MHAIYIRTAEHSFTGPHTETSIGRHTSKKTSKQKLELICQKKKCGLVMERLLEFW